jgi:hypothetical protein
MATRIRPSKTRKALDDVHAERDRQDELVANGLPTDCTDSSVPDSEKLAVLAEEFGEVARAVNDWGQTPQSKGGAAADDAHLREELIQTAAVAVAWAEALDRG